jgi:aspartate kinase
VALVVQKFGGTSVADAEKLRLSAQHALAAKKRGDQVILVVSAMGHSTDELLDLAESVPVHADRAVLGHDKREMDQLLATGEQVAISMMALTLRSLGVPAVSLTGEQAGILVDEIHGRASIVRIDGNRIEGLLEAGVIPVVAGFQGINSYGDVATLGRGGSDTTAVALAARFGGTCEIYKDVDGVFTADPRIVPDAQLRSHVSYDEMLEAASLGSQVIHPRAVELARKYNVPLRVLHSQLSAETSGARGTLIVLENHAMESRVVSSVVLKRGIGRVSIRGLVNRPGIQSEVFGPIGKARITVDDIIQEDDGPGTINLTFTLDRKDLPQVNAIVQTLAPMIKAQSVRIDTDLATVSAVGDGMRTSPGVAGVMFKALADESILVQNITTSEIRISCVVAENLGEQAVRCVHAAFGLGEPVKPATSSTITEPKLAGTRA